MLHVVFQKEEDAVLPITYAPPMDAPHHLVFQSPRPVALASIFVPLSLIMDVVGMVWDAPSTAAILQIQSHSL